MASPGWASLGSSIAGGNQIPAALAYEQGAQLGATTQDALAQARARISQNTALENLDAKLAPLVPDPKVRAGLVAQYQAGVDPTKTAESQLQNFKLQQQTAVADPNTPDPQVARSLLSIGQPANLTHAVGDNGNFTSELHPGQVTMSDLGTAVAKGAAAKDFGAAAASNSEVPLHAAQANLADAQAAVLPGTKEPTKYAPKVDAQGNTITDPNTNLPVLIDRTGGAADPNAPKPQSSFEARMTNRSLDSAVQGGKDLTQIMSLPMGARNSAFGYAKPAKTLMDYTKGDLTNVLTPDDSKRIEIADSGMSNALASMEAAGGLAPQGFQAQFDKLKPLTGDSMDIVMSKLAKRRQIMESALDATVISNPRVPDASKARAQQALDEVARVIPFTPQDVNKLFNSDGTKTMGQYAASQGLSPAAPAATTPTTAGAAPAAGANPLMDAVNAEIARRAGGK